MIRLKTRRFGEMPARIRKRGLSLSVERVPRFWRPKGKDGTHD